MGDKDYITLDWEIKIYSSINYESIQMNNAEFIPSLDEDSNILVLDIFSLKNIFCLLTFSAGLFRKKKRVKLTLKKLIEFNDEPLPLIQKNHLKESEIKLNYFGEILTYKTEGELSPKDLNQIEELKQNKKAVLEFEKEKERIFNLPQVDFISIYNYSLDFRDDGDEIIVLSFNYTKLFTINKYKKLVPPLDSTYKNSSPLGYFADCIIIPKEIGKTFKIITSDYGLNCEFVTP